MKKMACLITSIDFSSIQPFLRPLFSGQQELSKLDYCFQNGWKTGAQTNQGIWKLNNIFWWSKMSHIIIKGWNYMIKSFPSQVVFCFAILRAVSAYVGENWLSQYISQNPYFVKCEQILKVITITSIYKTMKSLCAQPLWSYVNVFFSCYIIHKHLQGRSSTLYISFYISLFNYV